MEACNFLKATEINSITDFIKFLTSAALASMETTLDLVITENEISFMDNKFVYSYGTMQAKLPFLYRNLDDLKQLSLIELFDFLSKFKQWISTLPTKYQKVVKSDQFKPVVATRIGVEECSNIPVGINPASLGNRDLDPLAAAPGMVGRQPLYDPSQGGMIMGPDHSIFMNPSPQRFPPGAVPPGARFDPVMPFGPSSVRPTRPPGRTGFGQPFSGDPDNDHMPPPGNYDFYI